MALPFWCSLSLMTLPSEAPALPPQEKTFPYLWSLSYEVIVLARFSISLQAGNANMTNLFERSNVDKLFLEYSVNHYSI